MFWKKVNKPNVLEHKVTEYFDYVSSTGLVVNEWVFFAMGDDAKGYHVQIYARKRDNADPEAWLGRIKEKLKDISEVSLTLKGYDRDGDYRSLELSCKKNEALEFLRFLGNVIERFKTLAIEA